VTRGPFFAAAGTLARSFAALLALLLLTGFQEKPAGPPPQAAPQQEPPEEDESSAKPAVYEFNPLQAESELRVGNFYFRRGSFRAAAKRFEEASKWNPSLAEAFLRWGDALDKMNERKGAEAAWARCLEIEPDGKFSGTLRKKLKRK
jgi:tetratricopeptide (TPR) repeat protein